MSWAYHSKFSPLLLFLLLLPQASNTATDITVFSLPTFLLLFCVYNHPVLPDIDILHSLPLEGVLCFLSFVLSICSDLVQSDWVRQF
jgi:hypothetical protein